MSESQIPVFSRRRPEPAPDAGPAAQAAPPPQGEVSLITLVNLVLRRRGAVVAVAATVALLTALGVAVQERTFESEASFMEQSRRSPAVGAAGLAAQLGVAALAADGSHSPQFYVDLVESRAILVPLVDSRYTVRTDSGMVEGTLVDLLGLKAPQSAVRRELTIDQLKRQMRVVGVPQTGVITLTVNATSAELAQQIAARTLDLLNRFNLERRQTQAKQEREFSGRRREEALQELRAAEARLQDFLDRNRALGASPQLRFESDRLVRDVSFRQQVYTTVAQAYEQARVDAIRDTPVITVIEVPEVAVRPRPRGLIRWTVLAFVGASLLGVALAFAREYAAAAAASDAVEAAEFRALKRDALGDLVRPWRPLVRLFGRPAARSG